MLQEVQWKERVQVQNGVAFLQIRVDDAEVVGWLAQLDEKERPDLVKRALKVGIVALSTTFIGNTGEMLKQSLER